MIPAEVWECRLYAISSIVLDSGLKEVTCVLLIKMSYFPCVEGRAKSWQFDESDSRRKPCVDGSLHQSESTLFLDEDPKTGTMFGDWLYEDDVKRGWLLGSKRNTFSVWECECEAAYAYHRNQRR